jgi:hypothetical protein
MNTFTFKKMVQTADQEAIVDLVFSIKDELRLPDRETAEKVVNTCFTHGGIIGGYYDSQLVGMMGYFRGEPGKDYQNKETAFMYVACITDEFRLSRLFRKGLLYTFREFRKMGLKEIRLQAEATNPYTNRLYGRFAKPLGESKSLRGLPVVTYGGTLDEALRYLEPKRRPVANIQSPTLQATLHFGNT